ncbi:MoaD/ThiS family protein [Maioricimonas sp. JC845]|uniref:MoaD/ThiS family protein n=1 Tax=Maioricimonas sp. JC845 TaxID=3232138 RepID=UPI00345B4278
MPTVTAAPALARWISDRPGPAGPVSWTVEGETVRDVLDRFFEQQQQLRGYVLDEQGQVRHHVAVFVDGTAIDDKRSLAIPVGPQSEIYLFQALSGG